LPLVLRSSNYHKQEVYIPAPWMQRMVSELSGSSSSDVQAGYGDVRSHSGVRDGVAGIEAEA
jgi:hypothetical protein